MLSNRTSSDLRIINLNSTFDFTLKEKIKSIHYPNPDKDDTFSSLKELSLQDVLPIAEFPNTVLISDYRTGLYVMRVGCDEMKCEKYTYAKIAIKSAGKIELLNQ